MKRRRTKKDIEHEQARERVIRTLRKLVDEIAPDDRYVLRLPSGAETQWSGRQYREYFKTCVALLENNSRKNWQTSFTCLLILQALSRGHELPADETEKAWNELIKRADV